MSTPHAARGSSVAVALSAVDGLRARPGAALITLLVLVALLTPYVTGAALADGRRAAIERDVAAGPDVLVTAERLGVPVPLPAHTRAAIAGLQGVIDSREVLRTRMTLGRDGVRASLAGLEPAAFDELAGAPVPDDELHPLVVGPAVAARLAVVAGDVLPPLYRNPDGERLARVVAVRSDGTLEDATTVWTRLDDARHMAAVGAVTTELRLRCLPGRARDIAAAIQRTAPRDGIALRAVTRETLRLRRLQDPALRSGWADWQLAPSLAAAVPALLLLAGAGAGERRREAGLLRALGFRIGDLLLRGLVENVLLGLTAAGLSLLLALLWLQVFHGAGLAALYVPEIVDHVDLAPPFRLAPRALLAGTALALTLSVCGGVFAVWRAGTAPPAEVMR